MSPELRLLPACLAGALLACIVPLSGAVQAADAADDGRKLFTQGTTPPCALCHTLADAQATGNVGPSLDEMKPEAERVAQVVRTGLGAMPPYAHLSDADVKRLAEYVAKASRGER